MLARQILSNTKSARRQHTTLLAAILLAAALAACSEDPLFDVEPPAELKEQLQGDEVICPNCLPVPPGAEIPLLEKEQLQDQDEGERDCEGCRPPSPGPEIPPAVEKEQLQGEPEDEPCPNCSP